MKIELVNMRIYILGRCPLLLWVGVLLLSLVSCKDDFDISKLQDTPRLTVYCFPTESDTTLIAVTKSLPIAHAKGDRNEVVLQPVDAHVRYLVNGRECEVERISEEQAPHILTRVDSALWMEGQYYVVSKQKSGDKISVEVSADGMESVSASTYIPFPLSASLDTVYAKDNNYYPDRLEATLFDDGNSRDYYAFAYAYSYHQTGLAVGGNQENPTIGLDEKNYVSSVEEYLREKDKYKYWNFSYITPVKLMTNLDVSSEPFFDKYSKVDEDFGFDDYSYFGGLYIFDDKRINGRPYTFHLSMTGYFETDGTSAYYYNGRNWDALFGSEYSLVLYTLTPEYYHFLAAINDSNNNSWADVGIMQVTPTYTNVKGGLGIVAGYYINNVKKEIAPTLK